MPSALSTDIGWELVTCTAFWGTCDHTCHWNDDIAADDDYVKEGKSLLNRNIVKTTFKLKTPILINYHIIVIFRLEISSDAGNDS